MIGKSDVVSIIIPIHNGELYIDDCLDSLVKQTYSAIEIVLVNDGSTDSSELVCRKWADKDNRIRYHFQSNKGVSEARNYGMLHSKGEYIAFVDVDDTCEQEFFETLVSIMQRDNCDAVFSGFNRCNLIENTISKRYGDELINAMPYIAGGQLDAEHYDCAVWGKIYRRRLIARNEKEVFFDNRFQIGEDYIWLIQVLKHCRQISATTGCLYNYNVRSGSASHSLKLDDRNLSHLKALEYCLNIKGLDEVGCKRDIEYRLFAQIRVFKLLAYVEDDRQNIAYISQLLAKYDRLRRMWYRNRRVPWVSKMKQIVMDMILGSHLDARMALYVYNFKRTEKLTVKK